MDRLIPKTAETTVLIPERKRYAESNIIKTARDLNTNGEIRLESPKPNKIIDKDKVAVSSYPHLNFNPFLTVAESAVLKTRVKSEVKTTERIFLSSGSSFSKKI